MADTIVTTVERWLPVPGHESRYEISDKGRVRGILEKNRCKGGILKPQKSRGGYRQVGLHAHKFAPVHSYAIHRLVMLAFVGPCPKGHQVNHIDYDRTNNALENLEYLTPQQNSAYSIPNYREQHGEANKSAKLTKAKVIQIRSLLDTGLSQYKIAAKYGVSRSAIEMIKLRKRWTHV